MTLAGFACAVAALTLATQEGSVPPRASTAFVERALEDGLARIRASAVGAAFDDATADLADPWDFVDQTSWLYLDDKGLVLALRTFVATMLQPDPVGCGFIDHPDQVGGAGDVVAFFRQLDTTTVRGWTDVFVRLVLANLDGRPPRDPPPRAAFEALMMRVMGSMPADQLERVAGAMAKPGEPAPPCWAMQAIFRQATLLPPPDQARLMLAMMATP